MAIRIIKEGKLQKFIKTCPDCGCEFEHDESDLQTDYRLCLTTYPGQYETYVVCPCCGKHIHHGTRFADEKPFNSPNIYYINTQDTTLDCDKCINKPDPNKPVFGDTPCTWCKKNVPYCSTNTDINVDPTLYKESNSLNWTDVNLEVDNSITTTYTTDIK